MVVQHNLSSANTGRQLKLNTGKQTKSTEKLSSGYRINRAADDAAGLSISEKLRHQIRGLNRGALNSQDGISVCQVADGALAEVSEILHRITELSVQAANDTNTDSDRSAIQKEIHELLQEIDRIGDTTEYNTQPVFQGGNVTAAGAVGGQNDSPVKVNAVSGQIGVYPSTKQSVLDSKVTLSCNGNTASLNIDVPTQDGYTTFSSTWDAAGLTVVNGVVKAGMYNLNIGNTLTYCLGMVVNVEKDISLAEFNQAMDGAEIGHIFTYASNYPMNKGGFGNFNSGEYAFFQAGDGRKFMEELGLNWGLPGNTFQVVLHRDANGKIYGELPNGIRLTEDTKTVNPTGEKLQIGYKNGSEYYSLKLYFDISSYDIENVESGFTFSIEDRNNGGMGIHLNSFTPAADSTADSLSAPKQWWIQSGDTNGNGFFIEIDRMNTHVLGIAKLDVSTGAGAQEAIDLSQKALAAVSESRSKIGAQQNRLEHTISNVKNTAENAQAAESRIRDTDMAKELVANATANILIQAGQSILTQNNQQKDRILELLA